MRLLLTIILCGVLGMPAIRAEVYLIGESGSKQLLSVLSASDVLTEPLVFNGSTTKLKVSMTKMSFRDALVKIEELGVKTKQSTGQRRVILETENSTAGMISRHMIMSQGEKFRTLIFSFDIPEAALRSVGDLQWPKDVPAISGAVLSMTMVLKKSGSTYVTFDYNAEPAGTFSMYDQMLRTEGWLPVSEKQGYQGAIYRKGATGVLTVSVREVKVGSQATVYVKN